MPVIFQLRVQARFNLLWGTRNLRFELVQLEVHQRSGKFLVSKPSQSDNFSKVAWDKVAERNLFGTFSFVAAVGTKVSHVFFVCDAMFASQGVKNLQNAERC